MEDRAQEDLRACLAKSRSADNCRGQSARMEGKFARASLSLSFGQSVDIVRRTVVGQLIVCSYDETSWLLNKADRDVSL
jgi:hypothetical protein